MRAARRGSAVETQSSSALKPSPQVYHSDEAAATNAVLLCILLALYSTPVIFVQTQRLRCYGGEKSKLFAVRWTTSCVNKLIRTAALIMKMCILSCKRKLRCAWFHFQDEYRRLV